MSNFSLQTGQKFRLHVRVSYTIPTIEPSEVRAGDTWEWTRTLADWPASVWTLTYILHNATAKETIVATADGDDHSVSVAPAVTALIAAGRYDWIAQVSDGVSRYQVDSGAMDVQPDLSAVASYDGRSHARIMLDALEAILEGRATDGDIDTIRASYGEVTTERDRALLTQLRAQYAAAVAAEDAALAGGNSGFVQMRFS